MASRRLRYLHGVPRLLVLKLLDGREMYGYELGRELRSSTGDVIALGEGGDLPALARARARRVAAEPSDPVQRPAAGLLPPRRRKGRRELMRDADLWLRVARGRFVGAGQRRGRPRCGAGMSSSRPSCARGAAGRYAHRLRGELEEHHAALVEEHLARGGDGRAGAARSRPGARPARHHREDGPGRPSGALPGTDAAGARLPRWPARRRDGRVRRRSRGACTSRPGRRSTCWAGPRPVRRSASSPAPAMPSSRSASRPVSRSSSVPRPGSAERRHAGRSPPAWRSPRSVGSARSDTTSNRPPLPAARSTSVEAGSLGAWRFALPLLTFVAFRVLVRCQWSATMLRSLRRFAV